MFLFCVSYVFGLTETFAPLNGNPAPKTYQELWRGFDPRAEPLDVEVLKEWEKDGVVFKILRYRIGIFKGQKSMMAAIYGYPKGAVKIPGLVQIHGGGQYADYKAVLTNAKRGYATISIAWAGRISAPDYNVNPAVVKLFWEGKTDDPAYKLTTDWGALDGYHAPCRNPGNSFSAIKTESWTLDAVDSPRNNPWFLSTLGARRALTFLEQQKEVDPDKLGVYGHSMGGKLTVLTTAADNRVKASAPSCGGMSDRDTDDAIFNATISDKISLKQISCPIVFLSPANDFHGRIDDLQKAVREIKSKNWRVTCSAHHNHQDTAEYEVASLLWFDQHLKGAFHMPRTPGSSLQLKTESGVPLFTVKPDGSKNILGVDIYYTQQGQMDGKKSDMNNTKARFWYHAAAKRNGNVWTADLPILNTDKPLWVYANVLYPLKIPVTGAGYYYGVYTTDRFNISSLMHIAKPGELKGAGVKPTVKPSLMIEAFDADWEKEWFTYKPADWARKTHKLYDEKWKAPLAAKLALDVRSKKKNKIVVGLDKYASEVQLSGGSEWQAVMLTVNDFKSANAESLASWSGIKELRLGSVETLRERHKDGDKTLKLGSAWQGDKPEFRNLRWAE